MYAGDEQTELDLRLFRVWTKATKSLTESARKSIESHGISNENFMILELLYNKGPHSIQQISDIFKIPGGSISYVVSKMEKSGYIKRESSPTDRRSVQVMLSEAGEAILSEIFPNHAKVISERLSYISNEEKLQLIHLLKKVGLGTKDL